MPSDTRRRLTEAAARRFYRDGFRNVGLDQVLADVGISKTAFYKHFECKEDLVLAALDMQGEALREIFRAWLSETAGMAAVAQLRAVFDVVERIINDKDFRGCIFVNVSMEYPLPHEPAHMAAARHKLVVEEVVHDLAVRAGAADPRRMARELCLLMEGAYVTRQLTGNAQGVEVARQIGELVISAHLSEVACAVDVGAP